jgi:hypothetical protein
MLPLHDIHLPAPVGWWPPAPGWWLLTGIFLLLTGGSLWLWRRYRRRRYRRLALRELELLEQLPSAELAAGLSRLLRRAALCHFTRGECAGLAGEAWLNFLDRPFADRPFSEGVGRCLLEAPYRPGTETDDQALLELGRRWLKQLPPTGGRPGRV